MAAAYDSLLDDLDADADAELYQLAADLAMEVSGIPSLLQDVIQGELQFTADSVGDIDALLVGLEPDQMVEAVAHLQMAKEKGGTLSTSDYITGGFGLVLSASKDAEGEYNFDDPDSWDTALKDEASDFLTEGIADLPEDDPSRQFLAAFQDFLGSV